MPDEKVLFEATLVYVLRGKEVLLPTKVTKIGAGRRNGFGGGVEPGETPRQGACRELLEETGLYVKPHWLLKRAEMEFHNTKSDGQEFVCRCHVYVTVIWSGELSLNNEWKDPFWYPIQHLPFHEMMPSDKDWVPQVLSGNCLRGTVKLGPFQQELLEPPVIEFVSPGYFLEQTV
ncbi:MAG TPA: NUDIX domain-containing protein [Candidatus Paceibacterota bacterium]|nr:NUDIX domain-containing protein [Candidatus Paceibacterota bacterium]